MNAHEAEIANRALEYPLGKTREEAQPRIDAYNASINEIIASFRAELEETYSSHLSPSEQERLWEEARAAAPMKTWSETEEAYRKFASQR